MAFFSFYHLGEIVLSSATEFNPARHLSWNDVCVDCVERPLMIRVHLRMSKCDQFGQGVDVFLGRVDSPVCPVAAVLAYIAIRGSAVVQLSFSDISSNPTAPIGGFWPEFGGIGAMNRGS